MKEEVRGKCYKGNITSRKLRKNRYEAKDIKESVRAKSYEGRGTKEEILKMEKRE